MDAARLSSKGQVTIPVSIRRKLGLRVGENVIFIEKSGNVIITSENGLNNYILNNQWNESVYNFSQFNESVAEPFIMPVDFASKDKRREILRSLYGSVDDPTFAEPMEVEYESKKDWELIDQ
jgi:AbrB family looped-hinge helix DNA binding protein